MLVRALQATYRRINDPRAPRTGSGFQEEIAQRSSLMVNRGVAAVLESIPYSRWDGRTLENDDGCAIPPKELALSGNGAILLPSTTWSGSPLLGRTPDGAPMIIYAALEAGRYTEAGRCPKGDADRDGLDALVGHTRAAVLRLLAQPHSTSGIARWLGISLSSASEHAKVLRAAGLLVTHRVGPEVHHSCTALGHRLAGR